MRSNNLPDQRGSRQETVRRKNHCEIGCDSNSDCCDEGEIRDRGECLDPNAKEEEEKNSFTRKILRPCVVDAANELFVCFFFYIHFFFLEMISSYQEGVGELPELCTISLQVFSISIKVLSKSLNT